MIQELGEETGIIISHTTGKRNTLPPGISRRLQCLRSMIEGNRNAMVILMLTITVGIVKVFCGSFLRFVDGSEITWKHLHEVFGK
jgi:hypothetical protein